MKYSAAWREGESMKKSTAIAVLFSFYGILAKGENTHALRLKCEHFELRAEYANPATFVAE
jgi:hypothetical protein